MLAWIIICCVLGAAFTVLCIMQLCEKGPLLNNAYIWASSKEREAMDKKPHYRQSGIALALCAGIFWIMALECILQTNWLWLLIAALAIALLAYAMASSVQHEKGK